MTGVNHADVQERRPSVARCMRATVRWNMVLVTQSRGHQDAVCGNEIEFGLCTGGARACTAVYRLQIMTFLGYNVMRARSRGAEYGWWSHHAVVATVHACGNRANLKTRWTATSFRVQ